MTVEEAIAEISQRVQAASPTAILRITRISEEEASIRAYAPAGDETAIKAATQDYTIQLLTGDGLDVQVLVYDVATSLPPEE
ncbi:hypothetical protein [Candidatus Viridilinea mediisalina]|uniref:Uncharacterized protein n=1 Tax=Candidatus Viridilinea mediisalina TaxID=2024553 RepID=A0A2A6RPA9_9CHLR|nr:hypothetical protein [Candidatus Viridilinea mediisalina]PDW04680.1 hypothetical protein CJ255_02570 [Candidatus Viridilinea mediisalina]